MGWGDPARGTPAEAGPGTGRPGVVEAETRGTPMETDVRRNPGLLKLDLYCKGIRLDDSCMVEHDGGRSIMRTRAGLGSGLEAILPG